MTAKEKSIIAEIGSKAEKERTEVKTKLESVKIESVKQTESIYTVEELSANARQLFDVRTECVIAALKADDIKTCTVSKAKEIIKKFIDKEVR